MENNAPINLKLKQPPGQLTGIWPSSVGWEFKPCLCGIGNLNWNCQVSPTEWMCFIFLSHAGQNYLILIGWNRGHFLLIMRELFGNQEGMITWCWLSLFAVCGSYLLIVIQTNEAAKRWQKVKSSLLWGSGSGKSVYKKVIVANSAYYKRNWRSNRAPRWGIWTQLRIWGREFEQTNFQNFKCLGVA